MMNDTERVFLDVIKAALTGEYYQEAQNRINWRKVIRLALSHSMLPVICEALCQNDSFTSWKRYDSIRDRAAQEALTQIIRTEDFLDLYEMLHKRGLYPVVMKGVLLRNLLYPKPEERISADEDLLIDESVFDSVHETLLSFGMRPVFPHRDYGEEHEVAYISDDTDLYIEVHKKPFPSDSKAYGDLNRFFSDSSKQVVLLDVFRPSDMCRTSPVSIQSMHPTDHLFYMICHAYKHFLHGGIGIRQVCDIVLYASAFRPEIDWTQIYNNCCEAGMAEFAGTLFRIGDRYLLPHPLNILQETGWLNKDEESLLKDILDSGVYGVSTKARAHSSNLTLGAVESEKTGKRESSIMSVVFLPLDTMKKRYSYLEKMPFLLPLAWGHRILHFGLEALSERDRGNEITQSVSLGKQRIAMFREYGILKRNSVDSALQTDSRLRRWYHKLADSKYGRVFKPLFYAAASVEYVLFNAVWFSQGYRLPDSRERKLIRENVTFIFKSFERQGMSRQLCENISRFYPGAQIIIADDSHKPLVVRQKNVEVIQLPYNSGLSAGLTEALKRVKTPYLVRLDDDELLTVRSNVHGELQFLMDHPEVDLIGFGIMTAVRCREARKNFEVYIQNPIRNPLKPHKISHLTKIDDDHLVLNQVFNLYIARTDLIRQVGYDPDIRMVDHSDFFRRASGIITSVAALNTIVWNRHNPFDQKYKKFRSDYKNDLRYMREKRRRKMECEQI